MIEKVTVTWGRCQPYSTTLTLSEAKTEVTLCLLDATNVFCNHKGLLGTQIHSPSQMPSALPFPPTGIVYMSYQHELC